MVEQIQNLVSLDLPPLLTALFSASACALLGNFLLLRRLSLMGDAISHSVVPGIVVAFLVFDSRAALPIFIGAAAAGVLTALLVELIRKFGRLDSGAAMGVVFSILFALGVLLMEQAAARHVDIDADCLLHGQLETIFWYPPTELSEFFSLATLSMVPAELVTGAVVFALALIFVVLFFKELKLSTFDPALSTSLGFSSSLLHHATMILVAAAVVASFRAVGSILVIAMIICPSASARLLTDRLKTQLILSVIISCLSVILGYVAGAFGPIWLGFENSVNTAGSMSIVAGLILLVCILFSPSHGVVARRVKRWRMSLQVAREDLLGLLFRAEELSVAEVDKFLAMGAAPKHALEGLVAEGGVVRAGEFYSLSNKAKNEAKQLVRSHRLWESYLVDRLGVSLDHVHERAEELEHFTSAELQQRLSARQNNPKHDPHGREIPK